MVFWHLALWHFGTCHFGTLVHVTSLLNALCLCVTAIPSGKSLFYRVFSTLMYLCTAYSPTISRSGAKMISLVLRLVRVDLRDQFMTGCGGRVLVLLLYCIRIAFLAVYSCPPSFSPTIHRSCRNLLGDVLKRLCIVTMRMGGGWDLCPEALSFVFCG
jgi:hypothetical protein